MRKRSLLSRCPTYFSSRVQRIPENFVTRERWKINIVDYTRGSPMTSMGTVFGINHQGMVIPIWLVLRLVTCSLEPVQRLGYGAGQSGIRNPAAARDVSLLQNVQRPAPRPTSIGYRGSLPEVKLPGCQVDQSPPSSTKVKNGWSCTPAPPTCLHSLYWDFTFRYFCNPSPFRLTQKFELPKQSTKTYAITGCNIYTDVKRL